MELCIICFSLHYICHIPVADKEIIEHGPGLPSWAEDNDQWGKPSSPSRLGVEHSSIKNTAWLMAVSTLYPFRDMTWSPSRWSDVNSSGRRVQFVVEEPMMGGRVSKLSVHTEDLILLLRVVSLSSAHEIMNLADSDYCFNIK